MKQLDEDNCTPELKDLYYHTIVNKSSMMPRIRYKNPLQ